MHSSQGMEFDEVDVDLTGLFGIQQAYVALSRAKSACGLRLTGEACPSKWPAPDEKVRSERAHWELAH